MHRAWAGVVQTLGSSDASVAVVAAATAKAADRALQDSAEDPAVWYPFWVITQLAASARTADAFAKLLNQLEVPDDRRTTAFDLVSALVRHVEYRIQVESERH